MKGTNAGYRVEGGLFCGTAVAVLLLATAQVSAQDTIAAQALSSVEVHGFVSQGFILTTGNEYLARDSTEGSAEFSEVGINFTKELVPELRLGLQLFAQDVGFSGDYTARFDWFCVDYRWRDWLGLRAGRPTDLPASAFARARFSEEVIGRSIAAVKSYWQQRIFSGRGTPPPELARDADVVAYVREHEGAVGYVSGAIETKGVKVLVVRGR